MAKIEITDDMLINGDAQLYASSYARCLNPDCGDFGEVTDTESPDVCCDGPWAIYVAQTIEDNEGDVLAREPESALRRHHIRREATEDCISDLAAALGMPNVRSWPDLLDTARVFRAALARRSPAAPDDRGGET